MPRAIPALTGLRFVAAGFVLIAHSVTFMLPFQGAEPGWHFYLHTLAGIGPNGTDLPQRVERQRKIDSLRSSMPSLVIDNDRPCHPSFSTSVVHRLKDHSVQL